MAGHINIVKLCVGADSVEDLLAWHNSHPSPFATGERRHVTRMWPKREAEVTGGGSLYWVIKGLILARQRIVRLDEVRGADGVLRCGIIMDPEVIRTEPVPRRPFQGWRYLEPKETPRDLARGKGAAKGLPPEMMAALSEIGVR